MVRLVVFLGWLLAASQALAGVELLPGSSPQRAEQGRDFAPIRVRVTDATGAPVAAARVGLTILWGVFLQPSQPGSGCIPDLGWSCWATADAGGVAQLPALYGVVVGQYSLTVHAVTGTGSVFIGSAPLTLIVDAFVDPPTLSAISGSSQGVVAGATLSPFVARALDARGRPMAGIEVAFSQREGATVIFAGSYRYAEARVVTDADGYARAPPTVAGAGLGSGVMGAVLYVPGTHFGVGTRFDYVVTNAQGATSLSLQDMCWSGFAETGWGVSIAQHDDRLFAVLYMYDANGRPTWHVLPDGGWGDRFFTFGGFAYAPRGSPYFDYDAARLRVERPTSYMHFTFDGDAKARLQLDVGEQRSIKALVRQDFTSDTPAPLRGLGDMWWGGPAQNGWGIAMMEQPGGLFSVWLTYDEQGLPTWFVMPAGTWTNDATFEGAIYRTSGPTWPSYDASKLAVVPVGSFRYRFRDRTSATFIWSIESRSGSAEITRQPF